MRMRASMRNQAPRMRNRVVMRTFVEAGRHAMATLSAQADCTEDQ
jgi:hypothetical protein